MSNLKPSNLSQIVYEDIPCKNANYTFGRAVYGDFDVVIMKDNSYINATKLCADGGKKLYAWINKDKPKRLVKEMTDELLKKDASWDGKITILVTGGENKLICGTYVHPSLIPHIASWVSTKFAMRVSDIVNNYIVQEYKDEIRRKNDDIMLQKILSGEKDDKITSLDRNILLLNKKIEDMALDMALSIGESNGRLVDVQGQLVDVKGQLVDVQGQLVDVTDELEEVNDNLSKANSKLDEVVEVIVPPAKQKSLRETFAVFKLNDPKVSYEYKVFCVQNRGIKTAVGRIKKTHRNAVEICRIDPSPNTKNILHRLKDKNIGELKYRGNFIGLKAGITEEDFIGYINKVANSGEELVRY
jgi:hypothetical protein